MKRCPTSLIRREMQIKTTKLIRMAITKKNGKTADVGKDIKKP